MSFESGANSSNDDYCGVPAPSQAWPDGPYRIALTTVPPLQQPPLPTPQHIIEMQNLVADYPEIPPVMQQAQGVDRPKKRKRASRRSAAKWTKKRKAKNA